MKRKKQKYVAVAYLNQLLVEWRKVVAYARKEMLATAKDGDYSLSAAWRTSMEVYKERIEDLSDVINTNTEVL